MFEMLSTLALSALFLPTAAFCTVPDDMPDVTTEDLISSSGGEDCTVGEDGVLGSTLQVGPPCV